MLRFGSVTDVFPATSGLFRSQSAASYGSVVAAVAAGNKSQLGASEVDSLLRLAISTAGPVRDVSTYDR